MGSVKDYKFVFQRTPNPCCFHQFPSCAPHFPAPTPAPQPQPQPQDAETPPSTSHFFISFPPPPGPPNILYAIKSAEKHCHGNHVAVGPWCWCKVSNFKIMAWKEQEGDRLRQRKGVRESKSNEKWDKTIGNAFRLTSSPFPTVVIHSWGSSVHSLP